MGILEIKRVTKAVEHTSFECGVDTIDGYIRDSYFPMIIQHAYAYSVMGGGKVLGYYQVLFREIELTDFPDDISEYDASIKDGKISSVHIRFIAVDKKYQKNKIGINTLKIIIKDVEELAERWPIRVITIDARIELHDWYKKIGFVDLKENTPGQEGVTIAMYFDCMKFSDELKSYSEELFEKE